MRRARLLGLLGLLGLSFACEIEGVFRDPRLSLERMIDQPRFDPYEPNRWFVDNRAMRPPPEGTVARNGGHGPLENRGALIYGIRGGRYVEQFPVQITSALLRRGQERFGVFCSACHGLTGSGVSVVAASMSLVKPPSLLSARVRGFPPGRIIRVIREGYGAMPSYALQLGARDRWAVLAYVRALQISRGVRLADLPPSVRAEAKVVLEP